jgi:hypothetical protein
VHPDRGAADGQGEPFAELSDADVHIVSARGSTEPQGGSRLLRPLGELVAARTTAAYTELRYPATFLQFSGTYPASFDLGDSPQLGVHALLHLLEEGAVARPSQHVVLLGWSQGAQVVGDALDLPCQRLHGRDAAHLSRAAIDPIAAIALFGNPGFTCGEPHNAGTFQPRIGGTTPRPPGALAHLGDRLQDYCARGDIACQNAPGSTVDGHVSYFSNDMRSAAARFILERLAAVGVAVSRAGEATTFTADLGAAESVDTG